MKNEYSWPLHALCTPHHADLSFANLSGAKLYGADLAGANLSFTNLKTTDLRYANFSDTKFNGATFCNTKIFEAIDNSGCKEGEVDVLDDNFTVYLGYLLYYANSK